MQRSRSMARRLQFERTPARKTRRECPRRAAEHQSTTAIKARSTCIEGPAGEFGPGLDCEPQAGVPNIQRSWTGNPAILEARPFHGQPPDALHKTDHQLARASVLLHRSMLPSQVARRSLTQLKIQPKVGDDLSASGRGANSRLASEVLHLRAPFNLFQDRDLLGFRERALPHGSPP